MKMKLNLNKIIAPNGLGDFGISEKSVSGETVPTLSCEIISCPILEVEVGTNGLTGDSGHGGRTYFAIQDLGNTDITVTPIENDCNGGVVIEFGGGLECDVFLSALKFAVAVLEGQLGRQ
jgi:hypothetical protein